jgi:hypothetical protein
VTKKLNRRPNPLSTVAKHAELPAIEQALARGTPLRKLEARYGVSIDSLWRYRKRMRREQPEVFQALVAADWKVKPEELEKLRTETSDGWLRILRTQVNKLIAAQDRNLEAGADGVAAMCAAQAHKALEMLGRAVDQIGEHSSTTINNNAIILSPAFWEVRSAILKALQPHPEARSAVLAALRAHVTVDDPERIGEPPTPSAPLLEAKVVNEGAHA